MFLRRLIPVLLLATLFPAHQADAQIYAWRDANGTLVVSDRKIADGTQTFEVAGAPAIRATTAPAPVSLQSQFEPLVLEHARRNALRPELVRAVIQVESGFNPRARSPKGAMGLMQLMPATASALQVTNPYDPSDNIRGGTAYLRRLLDRFGGDEELALAAYNAGPETVDRYGRRVPPFAETKNYVRKVGARSSAAAPPPPAPKGLLVIYKTFELVEDRLIAHYSTEPPRAGSYEIITK